ncbi:MAG TPA: sulfite exporter TauE/SafE family protein [Planctomycetota bacterium]|nr:sulfite exporter TauE/SafE family protein [Planctomycetota bacterium]
MKYCLLTLLLIILACAPVYAHDLTDREVESIGNSMELGIWNDLIYLDYWIAVGDLEAINFYPLIDADKNGSVSEEEKELFLNTLGKDIISNGLRIVIDDRTDLSFSLYGSRFITADDKNAPVPIKIEFEFLLDLERFGLSDAFKPNLRKKHTLDFWMTNPLHKTVFTKVFFAQGEGMNIPYTPEQRNQSLMFRSGFWLEPKGYNYIRLNYEYTGAGKPKFDRPEPGRQSQAKQVLSNYVKNPSFLLLALLIAFAYGAGHALTPGHGKTLVGAYLIGSRGTVAQAILLGLIVTATHLSTVIIAGVLALTASHYVNQTAFSVYLGLASGLIIVIMGVWIFSRRLTNPLGEHGHSHDYERQPERNSLLRDHAHCEASGVNNHGHPDDEGHSHDHDDEGHSHGHEDHHYHDHSHSVKTSGLETVSLKQILALGISGGMVPCPTAIVILLLAITLNKTLWGLSLILSFSLGLAGVLIVIGILMVAGSSLLDSSKRFIGIDLNKLIRVISIISPVLITLIGLAIIVMDLINSGVIILNPQALP